MNPELIALCDPTHTSQGYSAELMPYPIACIKSWLVHNSKHGRNLRIEIFKDPQKFLDFAHAEKPAVIGFSNYMWNRHLAYTMAEVIKAENPKTFVIFGGPNYPLEDTRRQSWLKKHSAVDLYIIGEGEEPFARFVDTWKETGSLDEARTAGIDGCHTLINEELFKPSDVSPRITDLNLIPSPYLNGYLDEFLTDSMLTPLMETNRGCPFTCTFCVDGIGDRGKIYRSSLEKFNDEIQYIGERYKGSILWLADTNFGMYQQDLDYSRAITESRKKYGFPYFVHATTGKNHKERVIECAEILEGGLSVSASVQSLDPEVMSNVKRNNISTEQLIEVTQKANALDAESSSEVILGMPGDTKEKHFDTVFKLADAGMRFVLQYTLMILEGTELATQTSRDKWRYETKFRIVPRCFGIYRYGDKEIVSAEAEEVCVASPTLSFDDYLESRSFALTVGLFFGDRVLHELYNFLRQFGIKASDLLMLLHQNRGQHSKGLIDLYSSFEAGTKAELFDSQDELEERLRLKAEVQRYINEEVGNNLLYGHRTIAIMELMDDIHEVAFRLGGGLLRKVNKQAFNEYEPFLEELKTFSQRRKVDIFDYERELEGVFNYDFLRLSAKEFREMPERMESPVELVFKATDDQKSYLEHQLFMQGNHLVGKTKLLGRMPVSKLHRPATLKGESSDSGDSAGRLNAIGSSRISNGEFT